MTRDQAVAQMQMILGFRSDKASELRTQLMYAQQNLESQEFLPWFLRSEVAYTTTTIDESRLALPDDFIREDEDEALFLYDADAEEDEQWTALEKADTDTLRSVYQSTTGAPEAYSITPDYFRIMPIADEEYTIKLVYYAKDTVLSNDVENKWLKHASDWLMGAAGQPIAAGLRDTAALNIFRDMEARGRAAMIKASTAREAENRRYVMGGPD